VKTFRDFCQERLSDLLIRWVFGKVYRHKKLLGLGVDITNIDTTFVREENPVTL
jgi:hypothetical protein